MDVVSLSPLRVSSVLWQPQRGGHALTVVAKATFRLLPIEARLAEEQEYPNDDDNHWNDDTARSLYSPSDLVPFKARPEVMLVGHAFAPRKEPVRSLVARIAIGDVDKAVEVTGDRAFTHDGQMREPVRFVKMPLRYERAAGGPETANPVGIRADARPDAYGAVPLPNLLPVGTTVTSRADVFAPTAFGPIAPAWPSRRQKLGRHAARFHVGAWNDGPLPEDIDPSYFNAAPEDQRPGELRDNERLVLENLHADHPRLVTNLPGIHPCAFVELPGRAPQRLHMECDTLWIDTDRSICTLTWRGQVPLESGASQGRVLIAMEEGQQRLSWSDLQRLQAGAPASPSAESGAAPVPDPAAVDGPPSVRDSGRSALLGMTSSSAMMGDKPAPYGAPVVMRPADLPGMRTAPHRPMTLTDVKVSDALPFLRTDRDAADSSRPSTPQGALPFAPKAPAPAPPPLSAPPASAELSSVAFARPAAPPEPSSVAFARSAAPPELSSVAFARPATPVPPPPSPVAPIAVAATTIGGALAASNAAAAAIAPPAPAPAPAPRPARFHNGSREIVDLLWFDPAVLPKVREHPRFKEILAEIAPKPRQVSFDDDPFEDAVRDDEPDDIKDRREIFGVVARAESIDAEGVGEAMAEAVSDDGTFIPPLVLLAGELVFVFDELSALKATVAATSPFATSDKKLKETLDMVGELLQTPWIQGSTGVADGLVQRLKEAFAQGVRTLPPSYLDSHTERMLLEQRSFQKRTVFGEPHLRTLLAPLGVQASIPTYLPEALANKLPMVLRMRVRILAEAHLPQDQYETYPASLKAVAIGRVSPLPGRR